jgi:hypothetical protein
MTPARTATLFAAFPRLYRGRHLPLTVNQMSWGLQCGDGWFALLYHLSQAITDYAARHPAAQEVIATEVKEKFGTLRFYVRGGDAYIRALIEAAEARSSTICELDGMPGRLRRQPGQAQKTRCDACAWTDFWRSSSGRGWRC